jgi:hypothetical protein
MARKPKNPINDIVDTVGGWLGGNRGSIPSSGAGAAWQASARSAAQSGNTNLVKGLGEVPVQLGALGMGTSAQVQRDVMYGVPGAGTQAAKEAAVSYVTGAAAGYGVGKVATKLVQSGRAAVKGTYFGVHGSTVKNLPEIQPRMGVFSSGTNRAAKSAGYNVPDAPVVYSYPATADRVSSQANSAQSFARNGSIYVVKSPANKVSAPQWNPVERMSSEPMKVVKEIKLGDLSNSAKQVKQSTEDAITAARAARDLNLAQQVAKAVKKEKVKTFIKGAIRPR